MGRSMIQIAAETLSPSQLLEGQTQTENSAYEHLSLFRSLESAIAESLAPEQQTPAPIAAPAAPSVETSEHPNPAFQRTRPTGSPLASASAARLAAKSSSTSFTAALRARAAARLAGLSNSRILRPKPLP